MAIKCAVLARDMDRQSDRQIHGRIAALLNAPLWVKGRPIAVPYPKKSVGGVLFFLSYAVSTFVDRRLKSATHGQFITRPTVTFPAAGHYRPLTGTTLYYLVTEAHV